MTYWLELKCSCWTYRLQTKTGALLEYSWGHWPRNIDQMSRLTNFCTLGHWHSYNIPVQIRTTGAAWKCLSTTATSRTRNSKVLARPRSSCPSTAERAEAWPPRTCHCWGSSVCQRGSHRPDSVGRLRRDGCAADAASLQRSHSRRAYLSQSLPSLRIQTTDWTNGLLCI